MWSLDHFKHYLYGTEFTLQTDHRAALLTALNENRGNRTYQSRLSRWVDILLPFNFNLEHIPGKNTGFADYLSRHPKHKPPTSTDDTHYIINLINNFKLILTQNSIYHISATRKMSDKYQTEYLTADNNPHAYNYDKAFCLNPLNLQSLILPHSIESNLNHTNSKHTHYTSTINPQGSPSNSNYI